MSRVCDAGDWTRGFMSATRHCTNWAKTLLLTIYWLLLLICKNSYAWSLWIYEVWKFIIQRMLLSVEIMSSPSCSPEHFVSLGYSGWLCKCHPPASARIMVPSLQSWCWTKHFKSSPELLWIHVSFSLYKSAPLGHSHVLSVWCAQPITSVCSIFLLLQCDFLGIICTPHLPVR